MQGVQFQSLGQGTKTHAPQCNNNEKAIAIGFAGFHCVNTPAVTNFKVSSELMISSCEQGSETQSQEGARAEPSAAPPEGYLERGQLRGSIRPTGERCRTDHRAASQRRLCSGERMGNGELWKHERLPMDQTAAENHISKSVLSAGEFQSLPQTSNLSTGQRSNTQPKHDPEHLPTASGFQPSWTSISHLDS